MNLDRAMLDQSMGYPPPNSPGYASYYANKENLAGSPISCHTQTPAFVVPATPPRRTGELSYD